MRTKQIQMLEVWCLLSHCLFLAQSGVAFRLCSVCWERSAGLRWKVTALGCPCKPVAHQPKSRTQPLEKGTWLANRCRKSKTLCINGHCRRFELWRGVKHQLHTSVFVCLVSCCGSQQSISYSPVARIPLDLCNAVHFQQHSAPHQIGGNWLCHSPSWAQLYLDDGKTWDWKEESSSACLFDAQYTCRPSHGFERRCSQLPGWSADLVTTSWCEGPICHGNMYVYIHVQCICLRMFKLYSGLDQLELSGSSKACELWIPLRPPRAKDSNSRSAQFWMLWVATRVSTGQILWK